MRSFLVILVCLMGFSAFADTPPARAINSQTYDYQSNGIGSTLNGTARGLNEYVINPLSAPVYESPVYAGALIDPRAIRSLTSSDIVSAIQSGTWNITNISGTVSLPTGAATSALQSSQLSVLNQIQTNTAAVLADDVVSGTITTANGTVVTTGQGIYTVSASLTGTWAGTMVAEGQLADNTWVLLPMYAQTLNGTAVGVPYPVYYSTTVNGTYLITGGGYLNIRIRSSVYTSGTVAVALEGALTQQTVFAGQLGTWNTQSSPTDGTKASYSAAVVGLVASTTAPTDIFTINGTGAKTIRITRLVFTGSQTTAAQRDLVVLKRSTANSGGTSTTIPAVPHDSNSAASTASIKAYTVNPTTGTLVGNFRSRKVYIGTTTANSDEFIAEFGTRPSQALVIRGANETVAVNLNGIVSVGSSLDISIEWTEE